MRPTRAEIEKELKAWEQAGVDDMRKNLEKMEKIDTKTDTNEDEVLLSEVLRKLKGSKKIKTDREKIIEDIAWDVKEELRDDKKTQLYMEKHYKAKVTTFPMSLVMKAIEKASPKIEAWARASERKKLEAETDLCFKHPKEWRKHMRELTKMGDDRIRRQTAEGIKEELEKMEYEHELEYNILIWDAFWKKRLGKKEDSGK